MLTEILDQICKLWILASPTFPFKGNYMAHGFLLKKIALDYSLKLEWLLI